MRTVILSSVVANKRHNGGNAWVILSWLHGLRRLGLDAHFVEQLGRRNCVDAAGRPAEFDHSDNLAYFKHVFGEAGVAGHATLVDEDSGQTSGLARDDLVALAADADLLINITGHLTVGPLRSGPRRKVYVDLDPGYTQFWRDGARLEGHDFFYTVGANVGADRCLIPSGGIDWRPIRQPVVLEQWPAADAGERSRLTTVASWRGAYGRVEHGGTTFGQKAHEWRKFVELPQRAAQTFEIALDIDRADERDLNLLERHGWRVVCPLAVAADPAAFRRYVQASGAEFSVAQGVYVETRSGWFSDRTVRYLASGKPALVQDTGFGDTLPTGEGLVAFRTLAEAAEGAALIARDYDSHARAARSLAEKFFDSDEVLGRLLEEVGVKA
jgi:hypothetical protein